MNFIPGALTPLIEMPGNVEALKILPDLPTWEKNMDLVRKLMGSLSSKCDA